MVWCFIGNFEAESICPAGGGGKRQHENRPPAGDETANNRIADLNRGNPPITSGSNVL